MTSVARGQSKITPKLVAIAQVEKTLEIVMMWNLKDIKDYTLRRKMPDIPKQK